MISVNESAIADVEQRIRTAFRVEPSLLQPASMPPALSFVSDVRYADDLRTVTQEARDRLGNHLLRVAGGIRAAMFDQGRLHPDEWNTAVDEVVPRLSWVRGAAAARFGVHDGSFIASRVAWDALHFIMERSVDDAAAVHVALWDNIYSRGRVPVGIDHARNAPVLVVR